MLDNFLTVAGNVLSLFIIMGFGFACQKFRLLNDAAVKTCANLTLYLHILKACRSYPAGCFPVWIKIPLPQ